jgi:hypothetical protein
MTIIRSRRYALLHVVIMLQAGRKGAATLTPYVKSLEAREKYLGTLGA